MITETVSNYFAKKNVVVTGGTGLIGRQVVDLLCDYGAKVTIISLDKVPHDKRASMIEGDLADFSFCKEVTSSVDCVFHIAGIKGSVQVTKSKPASFFVPLLQMNTNLLEAARLNKVEKVVYTSSIGAYPSAEVFVEPENIDDWEGAPMDMYPGWAKRMAEMQVRAYHSQYGLGNFGVVRLSNVYGPGDNFDPENAMVIPSLMARVRSGENPLSVWGDGSAIRDLAYSRDVAKGIVLALYHGTRGQVVNLGSGNGYSIKELVETLCDLLEIEASFDTSKPSGFPKRVMSIDRAREWLGFVPETSLRDGLEATWKWYLSNPDEFLLRKNYFKD
ncbi:MAG: GDP-L-fucose synthase [Candidatus Pelagisphaera sp.]|jgi:GDP-L-fucose synthase